MASEKVHNTRAQRTECCGTSRKTRQVVGDEPHEIPPIVETEAVPEGQDVVDEVGVRPLAEVLERWEDRSHPRIIAALEPAAGWEHHLSESRIGGGNP